MKLIVVYTNLIKDGLNWAYADIIKANCAAEAIGSVILKLKNDTKYEGWAINPTFVGTFEVPVSMIDDRLTTFHVEPTDK